MIGTAFVNLFKNVIAHLISGKLFKRSGNYSLKWKINNISINWLVIHSIFGD